MNRLLALILALTLSLAGGAQAGERRSSDCCADCPDMALCVLTGCQACLSTPALPAAALPAAIPTPEPVLPAHRLLPESLSRFEIWKPPRASESVPVF